jgi:hypothetical protein
MGFAFQAVEGIQFGSIDEVATYVCDEERRTKRVPISDLLHRGCEFFDDHSFGVRGEGLQFNEEGLRAFCGTVGAPFSLVTGIERPGLTTDLFNDLLRSQEVESRLQHQHFVLDEETQTVLGMVSRTYQTYSNRELLDDMRIFLSKTGTEEGKVEFQSAFMVNTRLRFRVLKTIRHGEVTGVGGEGKDKSRLGLQVANSMVGDTAVSIDFFIERLLCANGIIAPVSHTENRVFHSGKRENFAQRLDAKVRGVLAGAAGVLKMLSELIELAFEPDDLAKAGFTREILEVIPDARGNLKDAAKGMRFSKDVSPVERKRRRESKMIETVPEVLAVGHSARVFDSHWRNNATMFDFVNIFTEKAKELDVPQRVQAEERAGTLADGVAKNKRKFRQLNGNGKKEAYMPFGQAATDEEPGT